MKTHALFPEAPGSDPVSAPVSRRDFVRVATLGATLGAGTSAGVSSAGAAGGAGGEPAPSGLVDTNVYLGRWPFRRTALDETGALAAKLREGGVAQAWAGSFDALLHKDIPGVNDRVAAECARLGGGLLRPVGAANPILPGWEGELRRCAERHRMRVVRLHPNYHGYTLADERAARLLDLAGELGLLVQIPLVMEDERTIHPLLDVPPVDPAPLPELLKTRPGLRVQLLNAFRTLRGLPLASLAARGVAFEIAMLEGVEGVATTLGQIPADKLCFGSYAPFFYFESAALKLRESVLDEDQSLALRSGGALALLP